MRFAHTFDDKKCALPSSSSLFSFSSVRAVRLAQWLTLLSFIRPGFYPRRRRFKMSIFITLIAKYLVINLHVFSMLESFLNGKKV